MVNSPPRPWYYTNRVSWASARPGYPTEPLHKSLMRSNRFPRIPPKVVWFSCYASSNASAFRSGNGRSPPAHPKAGPALARPSPNRPGVGIGGFFCGFSFFFRGFIRLGISTFNSILNVRYLASRGSDFFLLTDCCVPDFAAIDAADGLFFLVTFLYQALIHFFCTCRKKNHRMYSTAVLGANKAHTVENGGSSCPACSLVNTYRLAQNTHCVEHVEFPIPHISHNPLTLIFPCRK